MITHVDEEIRIPIAADLELWELRELNKELQFLSECCVLCRQELDAVTILVQKCTLDEEHTNDVLTTIWDLGGKFDIEISPPIGKGNDIRLRLRASK